MPNPINRPSLNKSLTDRYASQHIGGAFDASGPNQPDMSGWLEKEWTKPGFQVVEQLKDKSKEKLGILGRKKYNQSEGNKGLNTTHKYSPNTV